MTVYQTKEWWSVKLGNPIDYDQYHLQIGPLIQNSTNENQIVLGSYNGVLRVYQPTKGDYKIEHLVYEKDFEEPIIQILIGQFEPGNSKQCLAILFIKKLVVIGLSQKKNIGVQSKIIFSNPLERNAYNMTAGTFGQIVNKDYICVQSQDGILMLFEGNKIQSMVQIENLILPSLIEYNNCNDTFVLQNSSYELESYKYSQIGTLDNNKEKIRMVKPYWSLNLGESAIQIKKIQRFYFNERYHNLVFDQLNSLSKKEISFINLHRNSNEWDYIVLTESMLFIVNGHGVIRNQKKLEYIASDIEVFQSEDSSKSQDNLNNINFIITSYSSHLYVYKNFELLWAAKLNQISSCIKISQFNQLNGLIVSLNQDGWLEILYLGTEPAKIQQGILSDSSIRQYEKLPQLLQKIKQKESSQFQQQRIEPKEELILDPIILKMDTQTGFIEDKQNYLQNDAGHVIRCVLRLQLQYIGNEASNVQIIIQVPQNLKIVKNCFYFEKISSKVTNLDVNIYSLCNFFPYENQINIQASYLNEGANQLQRDPRSTQATIHIPMQLQCRITNPEKQAAFKQTFHIKQDFPQLKDIFEDLINFQEDCQKMVENPNAIAFKYANGAICSILLAKAANKIRIQCQYFEGIYLTMVELNLRIEKLNFQLGYQESVPLNNLYLQIDEHYALRQSFLKLNTEIEKKAEQIRIIEKRLLTRFKEKNPTPLNNLDLLLNICYEQMMESANKSEEIQNAFFFCSHRLKVCFNLILYLIKLRFQVSNDNYLLIKNIFDYDNMESLQESGWDDHLHANLTYYLRKNESSHSISKLTDIDKLKKQITHFIDKISKDGHKILLKNDEQNVKNSSKNEESSTMPMSDEV